MQRPVRVSEAQLLALSDKARNDYTMTGLLSKRSADGTKWKLRLFTLYQNVLFYHDCDGGRLVGVIFLEGSYCDSLASGASPAAKSRDVCDRQHCFVIKFRREDLRSYVLQAETESVSHSWIDAIQQASFNKVLLLKEELEQKHLHLLHIVESEKTARWQYTQQCEELTVEIKKLRAELCALKKELRLVPGRSVRPEETDEIRKIKKVQSFFRGWLCRRRWKQIVEEYIRSPHAENMRKRNSLVFRMVEEEERYVEQLQLLISCYLRPFKMAASSKTPPCSHDDVNSIFLNSETVMFLHQIFLKGLTARMENWPTLVLGDLFDMLLPMLSIYQEYVRNHHYSLQVLAECKQNPSFVALLKRLEEKPSCQGRSLETFLTYPMHQIPRYITTLHELLAHTPHNHVERKSLENARIKLEELSRQMHDEVSETENIRKNLSIERMVVEGCDILLDVNQVFVRQGTLIQLPTEKPKGQRNRISSFKSNEKEVARQCFLFTNHLILSTRTSGGRLHLVPNVGKIPLADATLIEDPSEQSIIEDDGDSSVCSVSSHSSGISESSGATSSGSGHAAAAKGFHQNLDFKLVIDVKGGVSLTIHLVAPTMQEKNAWISDISHCMDNVHFNDLFHGTVSNTSSVTMPHSIRNDPRLFKDDIDIRFSRTLNSCKVPQIRYATPERLLERLTDLRFLSIDFLNTFLLTYRVFTDSVTVLEALKRVHYNPEINDATYGLMSEPSQTDSSLSPPEYESRRRISTSSVASSVEPGECERERTFSHDSRMGFMTMQHWRWSHKKFEERESTQNAATSSSPVSAQEVISVSEKHITCSTTAPPTTSSEIPLASQPSFESTLLHIPTTIINSTSSETLTDATSAPSSPNALNTSTNTLVAITQDEAESTKETVISIPMLPSHKILPRLSSTDSASASEAEEDSPLSPPPTSTMPSSSCLPQSQSTQSIQISHVGRWPGIKRGSADTSAESSITSPRSSFQHSESPQHSSRAGVVITSHRASQRRSSTSSAAAAFAVATAGSSNPPDLLLQTPRGSNAGHRFSTASTDSRMFYKERPSLCSKRESLISTAATMRVLNVLRHWLSKHSQDFESDQRLRSLTIEFLEELVCNSGLLPMEHKAASQLLRMITREESMNNHIDLDLLLATPAAPTKENIETLQALEIAEQMTYLDHKIFIAIRSEEFLGQAWNKPDKAIKAPHIHMMSQRFNDISRLVACEIVRQANLSTRIAIIEKWTAVADICRCFHNFNGVFQIASAFECSAVFRLKKTWDKVPKTHRQTIEKIKNLASYDGRFRNLRDALHRCDPPCIPFLGMYLSDLSFIEEGTPNFSDEQLLNFAKMRMIAHVIRDVRRFQQTPYKIELNLKVSNYLLDPSLLLCDEELYRMSLELEPRSSRLGSISH